MTSAADQSTTIGPVSEGTAVLHIGPHKTGTTALQQAMRKAREEMLAQGVRVAGRGAGDGDGARYAIGLEPARGEEFARAAWEQIRADLLDDGVPRRVFSRETFANAGDARARRLVEQLGRVHVVVSVRPLAELIPSQYSQFIQSGLTTLPFDRWLDALFAEDAGDRSVRQFWKRHRHERQVRRWGGVVGADNLTVIVVDRRDRSFLAHAFEQLLALRTGTLADRLDEVRGNRSLTLAELELVRRWQELAAPSGASRGELLRLGWKLGSHLRRHPADPSDGQLTMPGWARERADEIAALSAEAIAASGVRIIGDIDALRIAPATGQ